MAARMEAVGGEANTLPATPAVSIPGPMYPAQNGSWPLPPPEIMVTLSLGIWNNSSVTLFRKACVECHLLPDHHPVALEQSESRVDHREALQRLVHHVLGVVNQLLARHGHETPFSEMSPAFSLQRWSCFSKIHSDFYGTPSYCVHTLKPVWISLRRSANRTGGLGQYPDNNENRPTK